MILKVAIDHIVNHSSTQVSGVAHDQCSSHMISLSSHHVMAGAFLLSRPQVVHVSVLVAVDAAVAF